MHICVKSKTLWPHQRQLRSINFFRVGFGRINYALANDHPIDQASSDAVSPDSYGEWLKQPRTGRTTEMQTYLENNGAGLLATSFLNTEQHMGTVLNFAATTYHVAIPRVAGEEPYNLSAVDDPEAAREATEGALAALYLIREHHIAQAMQDVANNDIDTTPPSETLPGYYLG